MAEPTAYQKPRWLRDLVRFLPLKSQFVLWGNVRDLQITEIQGALAPVPLAHAVHNELKAAGYAASVTYDLVSGFTAFGTNEQEVAASRQLMERLGLTVANGSAAAGPTSPDGDT
jgi:hypothetical protein